MMSLSQQGRQRRQQQWRSFVLSKRRLEESGFCAKRQAGLRSAGRAPRTSSKQERPHHNQAHASGIASAFRTATNALQNFIKALVDRKKMRADMDVRTKRGLIRTVDACKVA